MKKNVQKTLVGVIVLLGYTTGNYGAGFIDSPSNIAGTQSSVSTANYGGGFTQSPPAWRHLTFWY